MEEAKGALVADWSSNQQNHNLRFVVLLTCWLVADGELRGGNEKARFSPLVNGLIDGEVDMPSEQLESQFSFANLLTQELSGEKRPFRRSRTEPFQESFRNSGESSLLPSNSVILNTKESDIFDNLAQFGLGDFQLSPPTTPNRGIEASKKRPRSGSGNQSDSDLWSSGQGFGSLCDSSGSVFQQEGFSSSSFDDCIANLFSENPPSSDSCIIDSLVIIVVEQPPAQVRTRTPTENRHFQVKVTVQGNYSMHQFRSLKAHLVYADEPWQSPGNRKLNQNILGGTTMVALSDDNMEFDLTLKEASTKHSEKEFAIQFFYVRSDGELVNSDIRTTPFYAYSHKKVLTRRQNVSLRAISNNWGNISGGQEMHIVGVPFVKGPSLKVLFETPDGTVELKYADGQIERYSESVIFFTCPRYPGLDRNNRPSTGLKIGCRIVVTNDGRHFSAPINFIYVS